MRCPYCEHEDTKVIDSRPVDDGTSIRRRRECLNCHHRFKTFETYEETSMMVVKKDGAREVFDRSKILRGMVKSCEKRPVSIDILEEATKEIEIELNHRNCREVSSELIGELIMEKLRLIDKVAYVRFASVYREFQDVDSFYKELKNLK